MAIPHILDHAARAAARLIQRFKFKPMVVGAVVASANAAQAAEDGMFGVLAVRDIDAATGAVLDSIGALVGTPVRGTRSDAEYRSRIRVQILANGGSGDANVIWQIARLMVASWNTGTLPLVTEAFPACYVVNAAGVISDTQQAKELARVLQAVSAAGVRGIVEQQAQSDADSFTFASGPGLGFGSGEFAGAYDGNQ